MLLMYFRLFTAGLFLVIGTLIWIPICMLRPANRGNTYLIANYYSWLTRLFLHLKIDARVKKDHKDVRNSVIISNHQSNLDIFFVGPALPRRTVSLGKQSLVWIPIFGQMYYLAGNILINRTNRKKAWRAMAEVARTIKEDNCNVWIMPEGTRSKGRGLLPFKKGPFVVAIQGQLPIYPVVFSEYEKSFDLRKLKPGKVIIEALEPISTEGLTMDDIGDLMYKTRERMLAHINKLAEELS
ncbi:putative 1-acyl-sn-glycerol-3-phosphate acyltransferase [Bacteriovorax sp. BAL6_X]|uniref:lysophospholipid acyltransferase family protein n=1 Tax=Bacteriovorax sp. BAL6_X TaxID=1201290 RepID=UPI000385F487|nr:1-acylglycerol-3-phosphate O-acyltransferase [Bacteriovorax sp. BAL6_X]EPZ49696.1 putative 1-acyl-sn-glycerol-3-phosphate acyltransferase [Bacteriovorax sp. BAL6_X]